MRLSKNICMSGCGKGLEASGADLPVCLLVAGRGRKPSRFIENMGAAPGSKPLPLRRNQGSGPGDVQASVLRLVRLVEPFLERPAGALVRNVDRGNGSFRGRRQDLPGK